MAWKKIADSNELIVLENDMKEYKLKIEARKTKEYGWEVFKTQVKGNSSNLISEYVLEDKRQVSRLIEKLKKETSVKRNLPRRNSSVSISLKRDYKEDFVEKWYFFIGDRDIRNFLVVKFDNNIKVDIVLHEKYRYYEQTILDQVEEKLGLNGLGESISHNIYYFRKTAGSKKVSDASEYNFNFIDIEFED